LLDGKKSYRSGSGMIFRRRPQFTFGSIQPPFARFPFLVGAINFPAIELAECDIFRHIPDDLVPNPLQESS